MSVFYCRHLANACVDTQLINFIFRERVFILRIFIREQKNIKEMKMNESIFIWNKQAKNNLKVASKTHFYHFTK